MCREHLEICYRHSQPYTYTHKVETVIILTDYRLHDELKYFYRESNIRLEANASAETYANSRAVPRFQNDPLENFSNLKLLNQMTKKFAIGRLSRIFALQAPIIHSFQRQHCAELNE